MKALDVFVDTAGCYDGACGAVAAPEPWFVGLLAVCLAVLWQGARATVAMVSSPPVTAAGTQLLGRRYGSALTALLFAGWFLIAFGLSIPALGAVPNALAWTAMVPLHATLVLSVPALAVGWALFAAEALQRPGGLRPASLPARAAVALSVLALPASWALAGSRAPGLVADPTTTASGWLAGALGAGLLDRWVGGLWWLADRVSAPAALATVAAAAACWVLLPHSGGSRNTASPQRVGVLSSGSYRRGTGTARGSSVPVAPAPGTAGDVAPPNPLGDAAARAATVALGTVVAVTGGAAAVAALTAGLGAMPVQGSVLAFAVAAGYLGLGFALRPR